MDDMKKPVVDILVAQPDEFDSFWARHRFFLLVAATIAISLVLVVVSLVIYNVSGSAQLDLSRPGYQSVSNQVERGSVIDGFSATGPLDKTTIQEFLKQYDEQAKTATGVDAFNGDPLNPEVLRSTETSTKD